MIPEMPGFEAIIVVVVVVLVVGDLIRRWRKRAK